MIKSFTTAQTILRKLAQFKSGRVVSNDDLFIAFKKDSADENGKNFVAHQVSVLKQYGLAKATYTTTWPKRRTGITLTDTAIDLLEGRAVAAPAKEDVPAASKSEIVSLQQISDMVKAWNKQNPSFRIDPTPQYIDKDTPIVQP